MSRNQFSLRTLVGVVTLCGAIMGIADLYGVAAVALGLIFGGLIFSFVIAWAFAYVHAPEATLRGTVFLVVSMFAFALISCWILRTRDEARRDASRNQLRKLGFEYQEKLEHQPDAAGAVLSAHGVGE